MKKLTVVGKGIVGALAVAHFLRYTDWDIDWIFDETIPTSSVGEATNLKIPTRLAQTLKFTGNDLASINGSIKRGISKKNWGSGSDYIHPFPIGMHGIHFSAKDLQDKIYNIVKDNRRLNIIKKNVKDPESLDSDYVMVCSGLPKHLDEETFKIRKSIPVNAAYVTQCEADKPLFDYSLTDAMPDGWVFGIPLQNRLSVGYLYNKDITPLEKIKEDVRQVFKDYNLTPTDKTSELNFESFSRKNNFGTKVIYNGNASFFLEPLEATSTDVAYFVIELAFNIWNGQLSPEYCQGEYDRHLDTIESMIALHYMAGSIYDTEFWNKSGQLASQRINDEFSNYTAWSDFVRSSIEHPELFCGQEHGTWPRQSYTMNVKHLGLETQLRKLWREYEGRK